MHCADRVCPVAVRGVYVAISLPGGLEAGLLVGQLLAMAVIRRMFGRMMIDGHRPCCMPFRFVATIPW
jgi:hypothetical protein